MTAAFDVAHLLPWRPSLITGRRLALGLSGLALLLLPSAAAPAPGRSEAAMALAAAPSQGPSPFHDPDQAVATPAASNHTVPLKSLARPGFTAPVDRFVVSSTFGLRRMSWEANARLHRGVDLAAPLGDPVRTIADGVVTRVGWRGGYGLAIDIRHADGLVSTYGHLSGIGEGIVRGTRVSGGRQIGEIGSTGSSTGPHLHLELRDRKGVSLDPGAFLGGGLAPQGLRQADAEYRRAMAARPLQAVARNAPPPPKVVFVNAPRVRDDRREARGGGRLTFRTDRPPERIVAARRNTITLRRD